MVNVGDLKTHILEGERCQQGLRTHSFPQVSFDEGFLRAWVPQTRIQRLQPQQRHQQHQRHHPPLLCPYQPPSRKHRFFPLDLPPDSLRLAPATFSSGASKGEEEAAARTNDSMSSWNELMSSSRMTLFSDVFPKWTQRTWLTGYYMVDL